LYLKVNLLEPVKGKKSLIFEKIEIFFAKYSQSAIVITFLNLFAIDNSEQIKKFKKK